MAFSYSSAINNLVAGAAENIADVVTCLNDVKTVLNNGITGADHLSASASVADTQLASPNNAVRKLVHGPHPPGIAVGGALTGTYTLDNNGSLSLSGANANVVPFHFDPADYAVAGKTTKLLVKALAITNNTAPAVNFTMGYSLVTSIGGASSVSITPVFGAAAGSTAAINAPAASVGTTASSSQFAAFAAGTYVPTVIVSGTLAANNVTELVWQLFVVNV